MLAVTPTAFDAFVAAGFAAAGFAAPAGDFAGAGTGAFLGICQTHRQNENGDEIADPLALRPNELDALGAALRVKCSASAVLAGKALTLQMSMATEPACSKRVSQTA